jgi:hypothetical protein
MENRKIKALLDHVKPLGWHDAIRYASSQMDASAAHNLMMMAQAES